TDKTGQPATVSILDDLDDLSVLLDPLLPTKSNNTELVAERRADILRAVLPVLFEAGFHHVGTRELAAAVGWNVAKLYIYIARKEDILYMAAKVVLLRLLQAV